MTRPKKTLCCDWGTSSFRLMLVDFATAEIIAQDQTDQGIAKTFALWQRPENAATSREAFYLNYVESRIALLEQRTAVSLQKTSLVLSGMASSSVGIAELPYKALPFAINGSDLFVQRYDPSFVTPRAVLLVSGVKSDATDEVMRGEETLLIGSAMEQPPSKATWFILPGTHSKHIRVRGGQATELKTYMTGEFFALLTHQSILRLSVVKNDRFAEQQIKTHFKAGVIRGLQENILHSCFAVRTHGLFNRCTSEENYYFLSGLLIGGELRAFRRGAPSIILVCGETLRLLYETALQVINANGGNISFRFHSAEDALIRGQHTLYTFTKQNT